MRAAGVNHSLARCQHLTAAGQPCRSWTWAGAAYCPTHQRLERLAAAPRCQRPTLAGHPCRHPALAGSAYCGRHQEPRRPCAFRRASGKPCPGAAWTAGSPFCQQHEFAGPAPAWGGPLDGWYIVRYLYNTTFTIGAMPDGAHVLNGDLRVPRQVGAYHFRYIRTGDRWETRWAWVPAA